MFPALDYVGFRSKSVLPASYVDEVETQSPGFITHRLDLWTSRLYAQLSKRYGDFGAAPAQPDASGTAPPPVTLTGIPTLGSLAIWIDVTGAGPLGTAVFRWSADGGVTWTSGVVTAPAVVLGATGITANFGVGAYGTDNHYRAESPVPGVVLEWITALVNLDVLRKRGMTPEIDRQPFEDDVKRALAEVADAANSQTGLFDLPTIDGGASAVSRSGPLSYTENSPFVAADRQAQIGRQEDAWDFGGWPCRTM